MRTIVRWPRPQEGRRYLARAAAQAGAELISPSRRLEAQVPADPILAVLRRHVRAGRGIRDAPKVAPSWLTGLEVYRYLRPASFANWLAFGDFLVATAALAHPATPAKLAIVLGAPVEEQLLPRASQALAASMLWERTSVGDLASTSRALAADMAVILTPGSDRLRASGPSAARPASLIMNLSSCACASPCSMSRRLPIIWAPCGRRAK